MDELDALYAFLTAMVTAAALTPMAARIATRLGAVNQPRDRGLSDEPTPLLGGTAIFAGVLRVPVPDRFASFPEFLMAGLLPWMAIQEGIAARRSRALVGRTLEVLVDGRPEDSDLLLCGRTEGQAPEIDGRVVLTDAPGPLSPGTFVRARIDEAHPFDLVGSAVEVLPAGREP